MAINNVVKYKMRTQALFLCVMSTITYNYFLVSFYTGCLCVSMAKYNKKKKSNMAIKNFLVSLLAFSKKEKRRIFIDFSLYDNTQLAHIVTLT